ncbi:proline-rich protein 2-like [Phyllostomus discolor]|uniref:Proline-rich protein 2-like n=1 Tax=Phyllostomus discolor TaxID=89673 RepID=A0A6J2KWR6_9CHIR|nr:proline-rich protein 2-like [Phyllostomus discolor]
MGEARLPQLPGCRPQGDRLPATQTSERGRACSGLALHGAGSEHVRKSKARPESASLPPRDGERRPAEQGRRRRRSQPRTERRPGSGGGNAPSERQRGGPHPVPLPGPPARACPCDDDRPRWRPLQHTAVTATMSAPPPTLLQPVPAQAGSRAVAPVRGWFPRPPPTPPPPRGAVHRQGADETRRKAQTTGHSRPSTQPRVRTRGTAPLPRLAVGSLYALRLSRSEATPPGGPGPGPRRAPPGIGTAQLTPPAETLSLKPELLAN